MATTANLRVLQGQTFRRTFTWSHADPASTADVPLPPVPYDLTGCTAKMQARQKYGTEVLLEFSSENGGLVLGTTDGLITIFASAVQTDALGATTDPLKARTRAVYDLEVTFPSGDVLRVIEGVITIEPNITRETV